jgi:serine protease Do/serine protease DegQ
VKLSTLLLAVALLCTCGETRARSVSDVSAEVLPSVVAITVEINADAFRFAYRPRSLGSGVIIDAERGLVLTNHHVLDGLGALTPSDVKVAFSNGYFLPAEIVGSDEGADIGVLRVPTGVVELVAIRRANLAGLHVGDPVVAVGNPFGLGHTVTAGVVSALHQYVELNPYEDFIQTDAPINPGNSGGALVNMRGELVGINAAGIGAGSGVGFAISADLAYYVAERLVRGDRTWDISYGRIGVEVEDVIAGDQRRRLGIEYRFGVLVTLVQPGGAAMRAGIEPGDVILSINDVPAVSKLQVGQRIAATLGRQSTVRLLRRGVTELAVTVQP